MLQSEINSLLVPAVYPELTHEVRHLQTHISNLFITDNFVYKIKKPVNMGFLDFTSLEKRNFFCNEELRLNRRFSPDIYLSVVPLYDDHNGGISFSGTGDVVEYAVKMVRLPEERMLSRLLDVGGVESSDMQDIAGLLARFHKIAATDERIAAFGTPSAIRNNWEESLLQTVSYVGQTLSEADHNLVGSWAMRFLEEQNAEFQDRVDNGFIRECDGDLHSDNICLDGQVHIFDCIEFNEKFRFGDTAADVAFLAMDLENHGRLDLASVFVDSYMKASGDTGLIKVLPLYLANRAFIRGKVESFRLADPMISHEEKKSAALRASRYFRLARGYALRSYLKQTMFITSGPTGCGKTAVASEFCFQLGLKHILSDVERKKLAGISLTDHGADIYGEDWNRATYDCLANLASDELAKGSSVLVDATFRSRAERADFAGIAARYGAAFVVLNPVCNTDLLRKRLEIRSMSGNAVSDGNWEICQKQISSYEPPSKEEDFVLISLDASQPADVSIDQIVAELHKMKLMHYLK